MWFNSLEDLLEHTNDIISYTDCDSKENVAAYYIEETGVHGEVPANLQDYIDYQPLGSDIEIEGELSCYFTWCF